METVEIVAETRERTGTRLSRRLRLSGRLPINLHFKDRAPVALHVNSREFDEALRHHVRIVRLRMGASAESAVIDDVQHDPVSQETIHADLLRVDLKEKVEVAVALVLKGPAEGEMKGGVRLEQNNKVRIRCLPLSIPAEIEADIRALQLHQSLFVRDLKLPSGVEMVDPPDLVLVTVVEPRGVEEPKPAAEGAVPEATEPELIRTPKKDAEDEDEKT